jgi:hypothetical protein
MAQGACAAASGRPMVAHQSTSSQTAHQRSPAGCGVGLLCSKAAPPFPSSCPHFFPHVVNSSSLAPVHARPTQTSSKNFKHT